MPKTRDPEFEARYREAVGPLMQKLAAEGRIRRDDDGALVMYPEGTELDEAKLQKTMVFCRNCRGLVEVNHASPFETLTLPPCPLCKAQAWEITDAQRGVTDGHLSAPWLPQ